MRSKNKTVYSTDTNGFCNTCNKEQKRCKCHSTSSTPSGDGIVRVGRQTKGRKGAGVTTITGIPLTGKELKDFVKKLKKKCGCGGTIKNEVVEIQGDQRDLLIPELEKTGWKVKRSGG